MQLSQSQKNKMDCVNVHSATCNETIYLTISGIVLLFKY